MPSIKSDFDHGNIRVIDAQDPARIRLEIKPDGAAGFYQWFYFRVDGACGEPLTMQIANAGGASYAKALHGYKAVASYDGDNWFRIDTSYEDGVLTIFHEPEEERIFYAYFAAYPLARIRTFMELMKNEPALAHEVLGETLDGHKIDYFTTGDGPRQLWVIARQHPGETMGSWWMEGFLPAVAGAGPAATRLREAATLHIVPCMNPDGSQRGHLRTNAAGTDLNRAWRNASMEKSPEVFLVCEKMRETSVDFFLDVHGDEAIANNFLDSAKGIPSWSDVHEARFNKFSDLLLKESRDFQDKEGYPTASPGQANLDIASNYVAETWGCLSMTLEMPFKDANVNPLPEKGWSPERCKSFSLEIMSVMAMMVEDFS